MNSSEKFPQTGKNGLLFVYPVNGRAVPPCAWITCWEITNLTLRGMHNLVSGETGWTKSGPWSIFPGMTAYGPEGKGELRSCLYDLLLSLRNSSRPGENSH